MGKFIKGDVVVIPFPFTDLSSSKKRPAVVLADIKGNDYFMLQITSQNIKDNYAIPLLTTDFQSGSLQKNSNIRPNKVFTLDETLVIYKIGHLTQSKIDECVKKVCNIIKSWKFDNFKN